LGSAAEAPGLFRFSLLMDFDIDILTYINPLSSYSLFFPYLPFPVTLRLSVILAASSVIPRLDCSAALCSDQPLSCSQYQSVNLGRRLVRGDVHLDHADEPSHLLLPSWIEYT
jgi:hypothetical protein